ncbi:MAG: hypothetical protein WEG36_04540 [Gemmatimonadota bacterium]
MRKGTSSRTSTPPSICGDGSCPVPCGLAPARRVLLLGFLLLLPCTALAQDPGNEVRADALRVFLDCNTFPCDSDFFRTEIGFVNWVRDRTLAQVHLIITSNQTGGGGNVYALEFIGLQELDGDNDTLPLTSLSTDTEEEILSALTSVIAAGLARYSAAIGQPAAYTIEPADDFDLGIDELVSGNQVNDPWNFWVFEIGADGELQGEDTEREHELSGSFEATRTTAVWRFEFEAEGSMSRDERELQNGNLIVDERTNWSTDFLLVRALADHWSLGLIGGAGASTRLNQDFGADVAAAVEYSFFPYVDAPRQSLTARYDLRLQHYLWEEETVFFETEETRPQHQLTLQLFQRQPWGSSRVSVDGSQFLHDLGLWSVSLSGDLEFRIFRGLNLEVGGNVNFIEDQIFLSREGLSDEDILLGRFERPTGKSYELFVGISYEFGSIFNNVVNNRFDSRNFGGGGGDFD